MFKFLAGLLLGLTLTQTGETVLTTRIYREGTAANNDIHFWHLPEIGGTCSADMDSPMGQMFKQYELPFQDQTKRIIVVKPLALGEISR